MINVDISKLLSPKAFAILVAFIPGLFFEISILVANPMLVRDLVCQSRSAYHFGYYTPLAMALALGFVIGVGFILWVGVIQTLFIRAQTTKLFLWKHFVQSYLLAKLNRLAQKPAWNRNRLLLRLHRYIVLKEPPMLPPELVTALYQAANSLVQKRYGMEPLQAESFDPNLWGPALGVLTYKDVWGNPLLQAIHATGWCGIMAIHFAPTLKNWYYVGFSLFLILFGIWHDWAASRNLSNPVLLNFLRLRTMLGQLRRAGIGLGQPSEKPNDHGGLPNGTEAEE
jgi:hypothetical protein